MGVKIAVAEERQKIFDAINGVLFTSFNKILTLKKVTKLIVPRLADYCRIAVVNDRNEIRELAVNHTNPKHVTLVTELYDNYKNLHKVQYGIAQILKSGKPEIISKIDKTVLSTIKNPKLLQIVKKVGLKSYIGIPLIARHKVIGAITFSSIKPDRFYEKDDLLFLKEVGKRIALALDNANLYEQAILANKQAQIEKERLEIVQNAVSLETTYRKQIEHNLKFLAEASKVLSSSLDYQTTLNSIASLAVPKIADWCGIDILDEQGELQQVAVAHKDPKKVQWAKEFRKSEPIDLTAPTGLPNVLRTGKSEIYPLITDEMLVMSAKTPERLQLMSSLGIASVMIVPLFAHRKPIGGITFVTSETRRRYNKSDLAMAEELASRISLAIENARLYKGSQDAINLRDDFISVASHELKTPVTSVKIFTQVLQQHAQQIGDQKAVKYLQKMDTQLNKLTDLIFNLLNISKIQAGRMEYKEKMFDFDQMVKDVVDVLGQSVRHKLIIEGSINQKIYGDEDRLGQVLSNLVSNAIKYSPNAEKVLIKLSSLNDKIIVAVQDFGIGIGVSHLDKIFERFYRIYADKTFPGLGIGLYISSEIVKRHNGDLWVESDPGKGSTFYFSLPISRKEK